MGEAAFEPFQERGVRRYFAANIEFGQPLAAILQGIHDPVELDLHAPPSTEQALTQHLSDGCIRGMIIVQYLVQPAEQLPAAALTQTKLAMRRCGPEIEQYAVGLEDAVRLLQGMNHALLGHSSEHPREHGDVECAGGVT